MPSSDLPAAKAQRRTRWFVAAAALLASLLTAGAILHARETARREALLILAGHAQEVRSAAFNPDGTRIVTASDDKTARVWDVNWRR